MSCMSPGCSQITKILWSTSIRHRLDTFASDRCWSEGLCYAGLLRRSISLGWRRGFGLGRCNVTWNGKKIHIQVSASGDLWSGSSRTTYKQWQYAGYVSQVRTRWGQVTLWADYHQYCDYVFAEIIMKSSLIQKTLSFYSNCSFLLLLSCRCSVLELAYMYCCWFICWFKKNELLLNKWTALDCKPSFLMSVIMMTSSNGNIFRVTGPLWGIPLDFPHKGQSGGALMFSLICAWTNG